MQRDPSIASGLPLALSLALLATTGCQTVPLHNLEWRELETPHFVIVSALSPADTRVMARDLELFHAGVEYIIGYQLPELPRKTLVYGFDGRSLVRPFDVRGQSSYFVSNMEQPILVFRTGGGFAEDKTDQALHEYAHFIVRQTDRRRPLWYEEGVAQMASTIEPREGHARVAPPRLDHVRTLRDWARSDIDPTLEASDLQGWSIRDRERFIAESWALAHYATLGPGSRRAEQRPLTRFRHALDNGAQPGQSARIAFGARGEELASALREYVTADSLNMASVTPRQDWKVGDAAIAPLSKPAGRIRLGQLSLALGRTDQARRYYGMASEDPAASVGLAAVFRLDGELEDARRNAELAAYQRPGDALAALEAGRVFQALAVAHAEKSRERQAHLDKAREHYARAFELDPGLAAARAEHASTYLIDGEDAAPGIPLASAAYRLMPGSLEIQLIFAQLEAKRGNRSTALIHATEIVSRGHDLPIAARAQQLMDLLRGTARSS